MLPLASAKPWFIMMIFPSIWSCCLLIEPFFFNHFALSFCRNGRFLVAPQRRYLSRECLTSIKSASAALKHTISMNVCISLALRTEPRSRAKFAIFFISFNQTVWSNTTTRWREKKIFHRCVLLLHQSQVDTFQLSFNMQIKLVCLRFFSALSSTLFLTLHPNPLRTNCSCIFSHVHIHIQMGLWLPLNHMDASTQSQWIF